MLEAFKDSVPDISAIGTHSLKSGGATAAANAGVPDRLLKVMVVGLVNRLRTDIYARFFICSFVGFLGFRYLVFSFVRLLIESSFYFVGLARGTVFYGVQLARGLPPRCKWTYGEVFHPAVVPRPNFNLFSLRSTFLQLFVTWTVYYVSMIWHVSLSLYVNKPSDCLEASLTLGLCVFLLGQTEI